MLEIEDVMRLCDSEALKQEVEAENRILQRSLQNCPTVELSATSLVASSVRKLSREDEEEYRTKRCLELLAREKHYHS